MDTIIYVIIGIFVLLYIIDKKELVKLDIENLTVDETGETVAIATILTMVKMLDQSADEA